MITTTNISKRLEPNMKQVPKPAKKPVTKVEPKQAPMEARPKNGTLRDLKESLRKSREIESGDDVIMKLARSKSRNLKCGGKVKAMKKGGKC